LPEIGRPPVASSNPTSGEVAIVAFVTGFVVGVFAFLIAIFFTDLRGALETAGVAFLLFFFLIAVGFWIQGLTAKTGVEDQEATKSPGTAAGSSPSDTASR
jgi:hypothetical protein